MALLCSYHNTLSQSRLLRTCERQLILTKCPWLASVPALTLGPLGVALMLQ